MDDSDKANAKKDKATGLHSMTVVVHIIEIEVYEETNEIHLQLSAFNLMDDPFQVTAYLYAGDEPVASLAERLETERTKGNKVVFSGTFAMCENTPHLIDPAVHGEMSRIVHPGQVKSENNKKT